MKPETIIIFGNITSSPVRVAWIVGGKTIEASYQQTAVLGKQ